MTAEVFADSSQFATEAIGAFRTVTSLAMEDNVILPRYRKLLRDHALQALKKAIVGTLVFALSDSADLPCNALVFW
jgi:ATP-binding cassette, subfamily B (MDR/TAP), member 1